jgi:hypothetical protein
VAGMVKWASAHRCTKVISLLRCLRKVSMASLDRKLAEVGIVGDIAMMNVPLSCLQAASIASCESRSGHGGSRRNSVSPGSYFKCR